MLTEATVASIIGNAVDWGKTLMAGGNLLEGGSPPETRLFPV